MSAKKSFASWHEEWPDDAMCFTCIEDGRIHGSDGMGTSMVIGLEGTPEDSIRKHRPNLEFGVCELDAGTYYPRLYRGNFRNTPVPMSPAERAEFAQATEQEEILVQDLRDICRVIAPDIATHSAYGSRIRNLLIMACTEIEAQWRGVLTANGYPTPPSGRFSTRDYVRVHRPLRLADYVLRCTRFRYYPPLGPFKDWDDGAPTQSLGWYDAYNATKHDRVGAFGRATLQHAIDATAALATLLIAQYGTAYLSHDVAAFFSLVGRPNWAPTERVYQLGDQNKFSAVQYPFQT